MLWLFHVKSWLIGKDSDAGRDRGQEEKGMTEDEMAGWHHWLDGSESEWTPGVGDGQGGLACCNSWGCKESDMTERLNWTELGYFNSCRYYLVLCRASLLVFVTSNTLFLHQTSDIKVWDMRCSSICCILMVKCKSHDLGALTSTY